MKELLQPKEALYRLLAATWDPQSLPVPESIPWAEVLRLVEYSSLGAIVYVISRELSLTMPEVVQQAFHKIFYRTVAANTRCLNQLSNIQAALSETGTPLLLLKGAALIHALYHEITPRLIGDIDLLIPREYVPACREVLLTLGYTPAYIEPQPGSFLHHGNQEMFLPPDPSRSSVELHWHLLDIPYYLHKLPLDWFWAHTEKLEINQVVYQVLRLEANLIYLPAHLALHHRFNVLHPYLDLALLILHNQSQIDWKEVVDTAQAFELVSALQETLDRLAQYWPSLPLQEPCHMLSTIQPTKTDARLFRLLTTNTRTAALDFYTTLLSLPNLYSRVRYAWVNTFPQLSYMQKRYNIKQNWHLPYWYLYRLIMGGMRFVRMLPQALRIDHETPKVT